MGQQYTSPFNCGLFENDKKTEVLGDQALLVRKKLELEKQYFLEVDSLKSATTQNKKFPAILSNAIPSPSDQYESLSYSIHHQNILRLSKEPFDNSIRCEYGFYEQANLSLASLVESRYHSNMYFPEEQVLKLLESVLYAASFFQRKGFKHHDLYPTNIFYYNGVFKLSHPKFTNPSYNITLERKRFSFLSPELIIQLRKESKQITEEVLWKSDVFALGIIMLEFCTLKPSWECYDKNNYDILIPVIQERLQITKSTYSPQVVQVVSRMLEINHQRRISILELAMIVNQYSAEYYDLKRRMEFNTQKSQIPSNVAQRNIAKSAEEMQQIQKISQGLSGLSNQLLSEIQQIQLQLKNAQSHQKYEALSQLQKCPNINETFSELKSIQRSLQKDKFQPQSNSSAVKSGHLPKPPALLLNTPAKAQVSRSQKLSKTEAPNYSGAHRAAPATADKLKLKSLEKVDLLGINLTKFGESNRKSKAQYSKREQKQMQNQKGIRLNSVESSAEKSQTSFSKPLITISNTCVKKASITFQQLYFKKQQSSSTSDSKAQSNSKLKAESVDYKNQKMFSASKKNIHV